MHRTAPQYSIRSVLILTGAVAVGLWLFVCEPSWQLGAVEFPLVISAQTILLSAALRATGRVRAFWLGSCAATAAFIVVFLGETTLSLSFSRQMDTERDWASGLRDLSFDFRDTAWLWAFAPLVGALCMGAHQLLAPPGGSRQDRAAAHELDGGARPRAVAREAAGSRH